MLLQRELYAVPSAAFCLGEEQIGAQQFNNSCTFCYFSPLHTNLDRRSTEPTEITPFLGNFPDSTLSSPSRTANALILGLGASPRNSTLLIPFSALPAAGQSALPTTATVPPVWR